jgi:hypothetical protein
MRFHISAQLALPLLLTTIPLAQGGVLTPTIADPFAATWWDRNSGESYMHYHSRAIAAGNATIGIGRGAAKPNSASWSEDSFLGAALAPVDLTDQPRRTPKVAPESPGKPRVPSAFSLSATELGEQSEASEFYALSGLGTTSQLSSSTADVSTMMLTLPRASALSTSTWSTLSAVKLSW